MDQSRKTELLKQLIDGLCAERGIEVPHLAGVEDRWDFFRALVNTRPPIPADDTWLSAQDELLQGLIGESGIASSDDATCSPADPRIRLWKGDITTLAVDAIVNAANSQLLGCWRPGHFCIDNAIHTYAGVQLRMECAMIMDAQGHDEPTGAAKITQAYNLPSKHVIHTVGPIAAGHPTQLHREQLADCYRSCLDLAHENRLQSLAFCCISTGVFGFPQQEAAEIAVRTVRAWLGAQAGRCADTCAPESFPMTVVFNVFSDKDYAMYARLLGM